MAPRDTPKASSKVSQSLLKAAKSKASPLKKTTASKSTAEKTLKVNKTTLETRLRTSTVPKMSTPKPKEKSVPLPGSVTKRIKKSWKRRPKPAHSGVPVPERMKKLLGMKLEEDSVIN